MSPTAATRTSEPHPLTLLPRFVERIWGTEGLEPYFASPGGKIGEVWLTAEECEIEGGSATLGQLAAAQPELFGITAGTSFPLLIKLLFPREKLSVQVHPDDAYAQAELGQPRGKTECWYVLSAEPGAEVAVGLRGPVGAEAVRSAIADSSLESHLRMLPVQAGDMVFIDAGTVHAIGPGVVLLETQQYSDVTYRLWDYGRPRELHVDRGLAVMRSATEAGLVDRVDMGTFERLLSCPYFTVDRFQLSPERAAALGEASQVQILFAAGAGAVLRDAQAKEWPLAPAHVTLLPVGAGSCSLHADRELDVIRITPGASSL